MCNHERIDILGLFKDYDDIVSSPVQDFEVYKAMLVILNITIVTGDGKLTGMKASKSGATTKLIVLLDWDGCNGKFRCEFAFRVAELNYIMMVRHMFKVGRCGNVLVSDGHTNVGLVYIIGAQSAE